MLLNRFFFLVGTIGILIFSSESTVCAEEVDSPEMLMMNFYRLDNLDLFPEIIIGLYNEGVCYGKAK